MKPRTGAALAAAAGLVGVVLGFAGCGVTLGSSPRPQRISTVAEAQATHEYPSRAPRERASGGWPSAIAAVAAFASAYTNWDARNVARKMRALAAQSVGQARAAMELAAADTGFDYELQRGGIANHGTVEAVATLSGGRDRLVVVTRELTTATATTAYQGLQPAWHVTIATVVEQRPGQWVVSGWQPQS